MGQEQGAGSTQVSESRDPQDIRHFQPTVFLYDNYPGGVGLSTPLYDRRREVVQQAYDLVTACTCLYGCPTCVGPILAAGESDGPTPKEAARLVLSLLTGEGGTLSCAPSAVADAGNGRPLSWAPSADAVAGGSRVVPAPAGMMRNIFVRTQR